MTRLAYDFNGASGTPLSSIVDGVFTSGSGVCQLDETFRAHGISSALVRRSGGTFTYFEVEESWQAETQVWCRLYLRVSAIPANHTVILQLRNGGLTAPVACEVQLRNNGVLGLRDSTQTLRASTSTDLTPGQWYRVEIGVVHDTTAGSMTLRLFHGDNLDGLTADEEISFTNRSTGAQSTHWGFGWVSNPGGNVDMWVDELALDDTDWIGPAAVAPPALDGSGEATLPALEAEGAGLIPVEGSGDAALPAIGTEGDAVIVIPPIDGSGTADLPAVTGEGDGQAIITGVGGGWPGYEDAYAGTGGAVLPAAEASGVGGAETSGGIGDATLPPVEAAGSSTVNVEGTGEAILPAVAADGEGNILIEGSGAATLPPVEGFGAGASTTAVTGFGEAILPPFDSSGSGEVWVSSGGVGSLPGVGASGSGSVWVSGSGTATLPAAGAAGSATALVAGVGTATMPATTASGFGFQGDLPEHHDGVEQVFVRHSGSSSTALRHTGIATTLGHTGIATTFRRTGIATTLRR